MAFGFGDTLTNLYQAASDASKAAFNKTVKTTKEAANALEQGYEYTKKKAVEAAEKKYGEVKNSVKQQIQAAKEAVKKLKAQPAARRLG